MRTIYVNNFRGFSQTYVDFLDVNFLVGENSSGKTSLLWAMRLLNEARFIYTLDFNDAGSGLGQFRDLVSVGSKDKTFFELGLLDVRSPSEMNKRSSAKNPPMFSAILFKFVDGNGPPEIAECTFQRDSVWVHIRIKNRRAWVTVDRDMPTPPDSSRAFESWNNMEQRSNMRPLPVKLKYGYSFLFMLTDAVQQYAKKSQTKDLFPDIYSTIVEMQDNLTWIAPIRTKPKRTYDQYNADFSEEGEHTPYLIKQILSQKKHAAVFDAFLRSVGKASGLFDSIGIHRFGREGASPFELDINLGTGKLGINNVGYGVSQSLPIFVELHVRMANNAFAIQQPEVHLHPKAQAALGEVIFDSASKESKKFVIETHSDYLMDRFRIKMKSSSKRLSAQVVFFERTASGNVVHQLRIGDDGKLPESQPDGYRKFFINEAVDTLELG
jgi:hypothetical protein